MGKERTVATWTWSSLILRLLVAPVRAIAWPFIRSIHALDRHFLAYLVGRSVRDRRRIYSVKFIWYGDSIYFHPMIWGSLLLFALAQSGWVAPGWLLLLWFMGICICLLTVMYNFNVIRASVLGIGLVALLGMSYFATVEFAWNPLTAFARHVDALEAGVTPGFYRASAYLFAALIFSEVFWAWLFHRVEIDESYVYEHAFLRGSTREPIFAREMKRETKDLLELLLLGAADIQHRTKNGFKRFKNVPFASLWVGTALDSMLDYRRNDELKMQERQDDAAEQARLSDAFPDEVEDFDDEGDQDDGDDLA